MVGAKDGEEFATINHLPNLLLKRQVFFTQALLHGRGAASGCALLAPLRDFRAEAVADIIASIYLVYYQDITENAVKSSVQNSVQDPQEAIGL